MKLYADLNKCGVLFWESNAGEVNARTLEVEMCENLCSCAQQFVVFTLEDGKKILSKVENGVALIPQFDKSQYVTIGLYGSNIENGECVLRYSPQPVKVFVNAGSYTAGDGTATVFENTTLEDLLAEIEAAEKVANKLTEYTEVETDKEFYSAKAVNTMFFNVGELFEILNKENDEKFTEMYNGILEIIQAAQVENNEKFATKDYVNEVIGGIENGSY